MRDRVSDRVSGERVYRAGHRVSGLERVYRAEHRDSRVGSDRDSRGGRVRDRLSPLHREKRRDRVSCWESRLERINWLSDRILWYDLLSDWDWVWDRAQNRLRVD